MTDNWSSPSNERIACKRRDKDADVKCHAGHSLLRVNDILLSGDAPDRKEESRRRGEKRRLNVTVL